MASTDKPGPEPEKTAPPPEAPAAEPKKTAPPLESKVPADAPPPDDDYFVAVAVVLRLLLFAAAVAAVVVMVASKQRKEFGPLPIGPFGSPVTVFRVAKFNHSPAFIYFVAALSVAGLYSLITTLVSFSALLKPGSTTKLLPHFIIFDVLILGVVAAATGAAGGVAYIGLKGDTHANWSKVCNNYEKFCQHIGASIAVSLFASIVLVLLVILSAYTLSKKIPK